MPLLREMSSLLVPLLLLQEEKKRYDMLGREGLETIVVKYISQQNQTEALNHFSDNSDMPRINMEMSQFNDLRNSEPVSTHETIE